VALFVHDDSAPHRGEQPASEHLGRASLLARPVTRCVPGKAQLSDFV
jgi:hypothetical protein